MSKNLVLKKNLPFIIAEIGHNHQGSMDTAKRMFLAAKQAGASAVKIQSFTGRDIISPNIKSNLYPSWDSKGFEYWYEFLDSIALPLKDHQTV